MKANNQPKTWILLAAVFGLALGATAVQAQTIGVNFPGTGSTLLSTDSAGVVPATHWNNAANTASGSLSNLVDNTGAATGVSFSFAGSTNYKVTSTAPTTGDQKLLYGFQQAAGPWQGSGLTGGVENTPLTLTLSGITYSDYKVYVYFTSDGDNRAGWISSGNVTFNTSTGQFASTTGTAYGIRTDLADTLTGTYVQATNTTILPNNGALLTTYSKGNYVEFDVHGDSTFNITVGNQGYWFGLSGIQVVAVPEPSTWALLGFGLVTVTAVTLRRRQSVVG